MRHVYTAAAIFTGFAFVPGLLATGQADPSPATIALLVLAACGGVCTLFSLWVYPTVLAEESWDDQLDLSTTITHVGGFSGGIAAVFMVWVPLLLVSAATSQAVGLPGALSIALTIADFIAAAAIVSHTWPSPFDRGLQHAHVRVRSRDD